MDIGQVGQIAKPFVMGVLGNTLGGPVAAVLTNVNPSQLGQLGEMVKGFADQFSKAPGTAGASVPQRPVPFSSTTININISINPLGSLQQPPASGPLQSFGKVPEVGNDSQFPGLASAVNNRITGSDANKSKFAMDGSNPWNKAGDKSDMAAVAWAMQKNENVRFDADRQQFYTTDSNGQARDVASLSEVKQQIANAGGANPNNGAGQAAVGAFLDGRIGQQSQTAAAKSQPAQTQQAQNDNPFKQIMELLDKLLQILTGGQQGGAAGANGAAGGAGSAQGAGSAGRGVGSSGGASGGSGVGGGSSVEGGSNSGGISNEEAMVDKAGASIDKMMGEAEKLMASDKPSDQLKGQMMMQKAQRMFEMISKMLEQRSQAQAKAIQAIK